MENAPSVPTALTRMDKRTAILIRIRTRLILLTGIRIRGRASVTETETVSEPSGESATETLIATIIRIRIVTALIVNETATECANVNNASGTTSKRSRNRRSVCFVQFRT